MPKKIDGYEDKNYQRKEDIFGAIRQCYEDIKNEANGGTGWNRLVTDLNGLNMVMDNDVMVVTYLRYEFTTPEMLAVMEAQGSDFFKEFESEMKKRFKKMTKKTLKLKKKNDSVNYEKVSRMMADTSWSFGSGRHTVTVDRSGKYLVKEKRVYEYTVS